MNSVEEYEAFIDAELEKRKSEKRESKKRNKPLLLIFSIFVLLVLAVIIGLTL